MVEACINSVCDAITSQDRIVVLCDGPLGFDRGTMSIRRPQQLFWADHTPTGMVDAWNACLDHATGDLVHVMHADDRVARDFYTSTRAVFSANPNVGVVATASGSDMTRSRVHSAAQILTRPGALRLLMSAQKPQAGAFVLRRSVVACERFSPRFPYCPDEEYFARLAARWGLAYLPVELYVARIHSDQARFATWMQPDFVHVYVDARLSAASALGDPDSTYAQRETALRIVSVCSALLEMNQRAMARHHLSRLVEHIPLAESMLHVRLMAVVLRLPVGRTLLRVVRALGTP